MSSWTNLNPVVNAVADEQGLEPGSDIWTDGGMAAYSGSTGGHPSYGWNHSAKLSPQYVRAVIANYAHRRCYYIDAPLRYSGYLNGGRPVGWLPEQSNELESGETLYLTSKGLISVSGPDVQHFQTDPLFTVYDSKGYKVKAQGKDWDASLIAGILIRMLMTTMAGQCKAFGQWSFGDRGHSVVMMNAAKATKRNLINLEDAKVIAQWFENYCLPFYEKAPGHDTLIHNFDGVHEIEQLQIYNGLYYLVPAFRDMIEVLNGELRDRAKAILLRLCQWVIDLDEVVPEAYLDIFDILATPEIKAGINGKPLPSLKGYVKASDVMTGEKYPSLWAFYAAMIAEEQLGAIAKPMASMMQIKWLPQADKIENRVYIVNADCSYAK